MKTHFLKLFDYDKYADLLMLQSMFAAGNPQKTEQIMAHLLVTQIILVEMFYNDASFIILILG